MRWDGNCEERLTWKDLKEARSAVGVRRAASIVASKNGRKGKAIPRFAVRIRNPISPLASTRSPPTMILPTLPRVASLLAPRALVSPPRRRREEMLSFFLLKCSLALERPPRSESTSPVLLPRSVHRPDAPAIPLTRFPCVIRRQFVTVEFTQSVPFATCSTPRITSLIAHVDSGHPHPRRWSRKGNHQLCRRDLRAPQRPRRV